MTRTVTPRADSEKTREKILRAAERLFAAAGFAGVSMREVGAAADVPFALVTYHFKNKQGLYRAVFERRIAMLSTERIDGLRALGSKGTTRERFAAFAVAFVEPLARIRRTEGGIDFARLLAREFYDPVKLERDIFEEYLDPVAAVAIEALRKIAPEVPLAHVHWTYQFVVGALVVIHSDTGRMKRQSGGRCDPRNVDELIAEQVAFITESLVGALAPKSARKR